MEEKITLTALQSAIIKVGAQQAEVERLRELHLAAAESSLAACETLVVLRYEMEKALDDEVDAVFSNIERSNREPPSPPREGFLRPADRS